MIQIARSCIELPTHDDGGGNPPSPQPMSTFRNRPAYVLLGDPGEGKTTSLKAECDELGDKGHWITARDFLTLSPKPEWRSGTLFIDGLDEVRAGQVDARTPFDAIRHKLDQLGRPSFRLSCRMADWLGSNDRQHLHEVSPDGDVAVLRLEPLTDKNILEILINHPDVGDPQAFFDRSKQCAIEHLLRNPQNLLMLITAFAKNGQFPSNLLEAMQVACEQLVLEHNAEHNVLTTKASPSLMLEAAGHLCALQLLAGNVGYAVRAEAVAEDYPDLRIVSQTGDKLYREALASKLFSSPAEGRTEPKHRQVAEYLGGRYLAKRIEGGLTSSRIIALMLGRDGTVVTPLRGLSAWVAAHSPTARLELIDRDPIGVGLYGDILSFSLDDKRMLLRALQQKPIMHRLHQDTPLNQDAAKLFGPVAAPGMEEAFREVPANPDSDEALDGLHNGAGGDGLSEPILIEKIAHSPDLKAHLEHRLANYGETKGEFLLANPEKDQQSQRDKWVEAIRSRRKELIENRATPHLLHQLAETYFGTPTIDGGARDGVARTREGLNGDDALAQAVLRAFQGVIDREDLPEPDQLLKFYRKGERHFLNLPFLVSLAESERLGNDDVLTWPDKRVQTALLLRHFEPWCTQDAKWYRQLVELRPAHVAKAIVRIGASELKRRKDAGGLFWPLAQDPTYAEIAKQCCLPLLRSFPTRCRIDQLGALDDLLWAAIGNADQDAFRALVQQKLERKSMNRPQRIHWLTAARIRFGAAFQPDLEDSIDDGDDERRIRHLVDFLWYAQAASASLEPFDIDSTEWLLSSVGRLCGPEDELSGDYFTTVRKASGVSHRLINHLAASPLEQASSALSRLSTVPELSRWREPLRQAFDDQRVIRRDADYRHPTVNQVNETLSQGKPANATDLAALVEHHLRCIAKEIRNSNTDDWRQYWNLDSYGRPVESNAPRIENACRDTLLSDLRQRLPKDVQAEPEGHQVNDCAADIVVSSNDFHVPVEAKRSQNPKLWSALQDQLIAKYAPYGPGIYLVFWFGPNETKPTPEGTKPKSPAELEDWLRDKLTPEERLRIRIVVVDVEQPRPASTDNQSRTATSQHRQNSH